MGAARTFLSAKRQGVSKIKQLSPASIFRSQACRRRLKEPPQTWHRSHSPKPGASPARRRHSLAQRRGPQYAWFWRDGVEGVSAGYEKWSYWSHARDGTPPVRPASFSRTRRSPSTSSSDCGTDCHPPAGPSPQGPAEHPGTPPLLPPPASAPAARDGSARA